MEKDNAKHVSRIDFSLFGISDEEIQWLSKSRPGDIAAFLEGKVSAELLRQSIRQDRESRHITGHAGLHEYMTFGDEE